MTDKPPRPMCFVAMPFGRKAPPGRDAPLIDFDLIYERIRTAVEAQGLECVRADFEPGGGFIHKSMFERLLVAEYVVADLTFSNPNVTYEVGVRHGASARPTILIGAKDFIGALPFDFRPLRVLPYELDADGRLDEARAAALVEGLGQRLSDARTRAAVHDNPIMQVTAWNPAGRLEHDKTDVFLARLEFAGEVGARIREALLVGDPKEGVRRLAEIERDLLDGPEVVTELHSALLGIFLGYRERKAFAKMGELYPKLPAELRQTAVAQEQYALALNRLAEAEGKAAAEAKAAGEDERASRHRAQARELRKRALAALDGMPADQVTSETWGIRGRIYKGWHDAEAKDGSRARAAGLLESAIETYEQGLRADLRDYYPGVNAVTLRLLRGSPEDLEALGTLLPVVRMAVDCAPAARSQDERYWQAATRLELASAARDWPSARRHRADLLAIDSQDWMRETTAANLRIQQSAFAADGAAVDAIAELIEELGA